MDNNLETEPQSVPEDTPRTPEPQPPVATPSHTHSVPEVTEPPSVPEDAPSAPEPQSQTPAESQTQSVPHVPTSPASSVTAPSVSSAEPSDVPETPRTDGPLSSLAQKAADTQLGRAATQNLPQSARPTLDRASRVLNTVDEHLLAAHQTLDTDEGRRVIKSAYEFAASLIAFIAMLFATAVSAAEKKLDIQPTGESLPTRFVHVCREAASRVRTRTETREKRVGGSCEARVYAHARHAIDMMGSAFESCLKGMSDYKGPGNEYVNPAAQRVISILPEDMQVSVRQSQGPLTSLRNGFGFESDTCSTSQDSATAASHGSQNESNRMKVD